MHYSYNQGIGIQDNQKIFCPVSVWVATSTGATGGGGGDSGGGDNPATTLAPISDNQPNEGDQQ